MPLLNDRLILNEAYRLVKITPKYETVTDTTKLVAIIQKNKKNGFPSSKTTI
jgi:hypothetical protein